MKTYKYLLICTIILTIAFNGNTQVITRVLDNDVEIQDYLPFEVDDNIYYLWQQDVDFQEVLTDDMEQGMKPLRYAVKVPTSYSKEDGSIREIDLNTVWSIGIEARKAKSLTFIMSDISLPEYAEMYIYSVYDKIIHGPIRENHINGGRYISDVIASNSAVIAVIMKNQVYNDFTVFIESISQGIPESTYRGWQDAGNCNYDINCAIGNNWQNESDAVANIIMDGEEHCTGTLINNECSDLTPYLLTAFHCIDTDRDGDLESHEEASLINWGFRFKYEASAPTCPGNSSGTQGQWIYYSGSVLKAANVTSDFLLIELNNDLENVPGLALAGWNRSTNASISGASIHHPEGDAKKISTYVLPAVRDDNYYGSNLQNWVVTWNKGVTEDKSSGAPLFDQNNRLIGQLWGGRSVCNGQNLDDGYGRFDNSWTGGNSSDTRLSDWLGGSVNPITTNTINVPWINTGANIYICTSNKTISLINPIPGRSVTWSVSPTALFATTGGASTSGSGTNATLRAKNSLISGSATITFTLTDSGCDAVTLEEDLWVGKPQKPTTSPFGNPAVEIGVGGRVTVYLTAWPGATSQYTGDWEAYGAVSEVYPNYIGPYSTFEGDYEGTGNWSVSTSNACGISTPSAGQIIVSGVCNPCYGIGIENPIDNTIRIKIYPEGKIYDQNDKIEDLSSKVLIYDQMGRLVSTSDFRGTQYDMYVGNIATGIYYVKVVNPHYEYSKKVFIDNL